MQLSPFGIIDVTGSSTLSHPYRVTALSPRRPTRFALRPSEAERQALAAEIGILAISELRFEGEIRADGRHDFLLEGGLEASVVQACVVTLAPVETRIAEPVRRRYLADFTLPDGDEIEIPQDDTEEPLGSVIDPGEVMIEALSLALPDYPRAEGAEAGEIVHAAPGIEPLRETDLKPFAGLASLADRLRAAEAPDGTKPDGKPRDGTEPESES
ncbi:YceD family protein [Allitabrizicola rongguiensis]|uniref:YceD family protein n=1 Tax=Alitabrizicola rongguiensis TaxID=2909234 RepID=UPI001F2564E2|nr:DUF177 domain-containing protein [Tabrizicola rongguiensis]